MNTCPKCKQLFLKSEVFCPDCDPEYWQGFCAGKDPFPEFTPAWFEGWVKNFEWTFAKTMPQWPHFYIVKEKVEAGTDWDKAVAIIRCFGIFQKWGNKKTQHAYLSDGRYLYWTMGHPVRITRIINRAAIL